MRKEGHMCFLVRGDLPQVGIEVIFEASVHEIILGVVLEPRLIEGGLEMLESQSIVEDIS